MPRTGIRAAEVEVTEDADDKAGADAEREGADEDAVIWSKSADVD